MSSAQKAVTLDPTLTTAHNVLAKYYLDSGENVLAAKECRLVLVQSPADQTALYHLVIALRKTVSRGDPRPAEETGQRPPGCYQSRKANGTATSSS